MLSTLAVTPLDPHHSAPYGVILGLPAIESDPSTFKSASSDFWRTHIFHNGEASAEVLWVSYRPQSMVLRSMEAHRLTQQAIVPLTGPIIQVLAISNAQGEPDMASLRAFEIPQGQGFCMYPNVWHATRVRDAEVVCLMLTRASTTRDLAVSLREGKSPEESAFAGIEDITIA
jgi:ureidoglycolate hydrolase